jgi:predicted TIM-barrel fold metal-dependent hydrolase
VIPRCAALQLSNINFRANRKGPWAANLVKRVKPIIGAAGNEQAEPPSSELVAAKFHPYVETCTEAFGASHCMFESNFPTDEISYNYPVFWNAAS